MMKTNCNRIRRELDETELGGASSTWVLRHLQQCVGCQEFQQSRIKLRELVASLETVKAPPDFDFRLRARLAGGKAELTQRPGFGTLSPGFRVLAAAAIVLMVGFVLFFTQRPSQPSSLANVQLAEPAHKEVAVTEPAGTKPNGYNKLVTPITKEPLAQRQKPLPNAAPAAIRGRRQMATADFSSVSAPVFRREESVARAGSTTVFPIGPANQSLKVSLDDGTGNWRTISLPTVSFGSQRVVVTGSVSSQLAAKGIW